MGFKDPVFAGDGTLVQTQAKSPNYSAGVDGWTINEDGTVEFNKGVFRGSLITGTFVRALAASGAFVEMNAVLQSFRLQPATPTGGHTLDAGASINAGVASDASTAVLSFVAPGVDGLAQAYMNLVSRTLAVAKSELQIVADRITLNASGGLGGRAYLEQSPNVCMVSDTAPSAAAGNNVESVFLTTDVGEFRAGRAYQVEHTGRFFTTGAGATTAEPIFRFRKGTTTAGTLLGLPGRKKASGIGSAEADAGCAAIFYCATDQSAQVSLTINSAVAGVTVTSTGNFSARTLRVIDIGPADEWTVGGVPSIG